jgi:hypothetical protein
MSQCRQPRVFFSLRGNFPETVSVGIRQHRETLLTRDRVLSVGQACHSITGALCWRARTAQSTHTPRDYALATHPTFGPPDRPEALPCSITPPTRSNTLRVLLCLRLDPWLVKLDRPPAVRVGDATKCLVIVSALHVPKSPGEHQPPATAEVSITTTIVTYSCILRATTDLCARLGTRPT